MELADLKVGDSVRLRGGMGNSVDQVMAVEAIEIYYHRITGHPRKVIVLADGHEFDGITGYAITPPTAYCIEILDGGIKQIPKKSVPIQVSGKMFDQLLLTPGVKLPFTWWMQVHDRRKYCLFEDGWAIKIKA